MLGQRDHPREFSGRRWRDLELRAVRPAGVVAPGAVLLGAGEMAVGAWLTRIPGFAMFVGELGARPAQLPEVAGRGMLARFALVGDMAVHPPRAPPAKRSGGILTAPPTLRAQPGLT